MKDLYLIKDRQLPIDQLHARRQELSVSPALREGLTWAQEHVTKHHYLHAPVDTRCRPFAYVVDLPFERVGCIIFGRPQATACYQGELTYGSTEDVQSGRARYDRWEILNMARVWLDPSIQKGGDYYIPRAASYVIAEALRQVTYDYLIAYPPVDCSFPYQIRCVLSYCDTRIHTGYIYMVSRFKLARTNDDGIQTWMKPLPGLPSDDDVLVRRHSEQSPRSKRIRSLRRQEARQLSF